MSARIATLFACLCSGSLAAELAWEELPPLPDEVGVAGPFVGVHRDVILVAGGANFPEGLPWHALDDGRMPPKVYHDEVYSLRRENKAWVWRGEEVHLPARLGYGVSVDTPEGLLCIGGESKAGDDGASQVRSLSDEVYLLQVKAGTVERSETYRGKALPPLPVGLASAAGGRIGDTVYVAGGDAGSGATNAFFALDLSAPELVWASLPPWDGPGRLLPVGVVQNGHFFLWSGRRLNRIGDWEVLTDGYRFDGKNWKTLRTVLAGDEPRCIMGATAVPVGVHGVLVLGGADGKQFKEIIHADARLKLASPAERPKLLARLNRLRETQHAGFSRDVLSFNAVTESWSMLNPLPTNSAVTTRAVMWRDKVVMPSGEIHPGVRSPRVWLGRPDSGPRFGTFNTITLGLYLVAILINGAWFSRRMKSTDDFFKAGGRIPGWAAGLSIFGTQLSAITFISIPATVYATDWRRFVAQVTIVAVAPLIVLFFLPFYRRLDVTTAYEYLERRFNVWVRTFASSLFIILQFGRIGIVLFLPAIALSVATGLSIDLCILLMGLLCVAYTTMGGMEAVIWTDVVQVVVLLGGAVLALLIMVARAGGGVLFDMAHAHDKLRMFDFRWDISDATFWTLLLAGFALNIISYGTDQSVIQRYLTTKDEGEAARSIWTNAALVIPASIVFFLIGSFLFSYYAIQPEQLDPFLPKQAGLFPAFMISELPAGVAGLVIAAVFAASMSSLDSSMNSVSAAVTTDFYRRFTAVPSERTALVVARVVVVVVGLLGTGFALWMAHSDIKSLWDQFSKIVGLFGGGLAGVFLMGMFTRHASAAGALAGLLVSGAVQYWLVQLSGWEIHAWFYATTGLLVCLVVGMLVSTAAKRKQDVDGLTFSTLVKPE